MLRLRLIIADSHKLWHRTDATEKSQEPSSCFRSTTIAFSDYKYKQSIVDIVKEERKKCRKQNQTKN